MSIRRRTNSNRRQLRSGNNATGSGLLFPSMLPLDFWMYGDDGGAAFTSGTYSGIPNRGTVTPALLPTGGGNVPVTTRGAAGRRAPLHTSGRAFTGNTITAARLSEPTGACEFWVALWTDTVQGCRLATTRAASLGQKGFYLEPLASGRLDLYMGDGGGANTLAITSGATAAIAASSLRVIRVARSLLAVSIEIGGVAYASASASALTAGATAGSFSLGGTTAGTSPVAGSVCEAFLTQRALTAGEATAALSYLTGRWGA